MVLLVTSRPVTVFALGDFRVIHQNASSVWQYGDLSVQYDASGGARGREQHLADCGQALLNHIFSLDACKLQRMLEDVGRGGVGRCWKGVIRVPPVGSFRISTPQQILKSALETEVDLKVVASAVETDWRGSATAEVDLRASLHARPNDGVPSGEAPGSGRQPPPDVPPREEQLMIRAVADSAAPVGPRPPTHIASQGSGPLEGLETITLEDGVRALECEPFSLEMAAPTRQVSPVGWAGVAAGDQRDPGPGLAGDARRTSLSLQPLTPGAPKPHGRNAEEGTLWLQQQEQQQPDGTGDAGAYPSAGGQGGLLEAVGLVPSRGGGGCDVQELRRRTSLASLLLSGPGTHPTPAPATDDAPVLTQKQDSCGTGSTSGGASGTLQLTVAAAAGNVGPCVPPSPFSRSYAVAAAGTAASAGTSVAEARASRLRPRRAATNTSIGTLPATSGLLFHAGSHSRRVLEKDGGGGASTSCIPRARVLLPLGRPAAASDAGALPRDMDELAAAVPEHSSANSPSPFKFVLRTGVELQGSSGPRGQASQLRPEDAGTSLLRRGPSDKARFSVSGAHALLDTQSRWPVLAAVGAGSQMLQPNDPLATSTFSLSLGPLQLPLVAPVPTSAGPCPGTLHLQQHSHHGQHQPQRHPAGPPQVGLGLGPPGRGESQYGIPTSVTAASTTGLIGPALSLTSAYTSTSAANQQFSYHVHHTLHSSLARQQPTAAASGTTTLVAAAAAAAAAAEGAVAGGCSNGSPVLPASLQSPGSAQRKGWGLQVPGGWLHGGGGGSGGAPLLLPDGSFRLPSESTATNTTNTPNTTNTTNTINTSAAAAAVMAPGCPSFPSNHHTGCLSTHLEHLVALPGPGHGRHAREQPRVRPPAPVVPPPNRARPCVPKWTNGDWEHGLAPPGAAPGGSLTLSTAPAAQPHAKLLQRTAAAAAADAGAMGAERGAAAAATPAAAAEERAQPGAAPSFDEQDAAWEIRMVAGAVAVDAEAGLGAAGELCKEAGRPLADGAEVEALAAPAPVRVELPSGGAPPPPPPTPDAAVQHPAGKTAGGGEEWRGDSDDDMLGPRGAHPPKNNPTIATSTATTASTDATVTSAAAAAGNPSATSNPSGNAARDSGASAGASASLSESQHQQNLEAVAVKPTDVLLPAVRSYVRAGPNQEGAADGRVAADGRLAGPRSGPGPCAKPAAFPTRLVADLPAQRKNDTKQVASDADGGGAAADHCSQGGATTAANCSPDGGGDTAAVCARGSVTRWLLSELGTSETVYGRELCSGFFTVDVQGGAAREPSLERTSEAVSLARELGGGGPPSSLGMRLAPPPSLSRGLGSLPVAAAAGAAPGPFLDSRRGLGLAAGAVGSGGAGELAAPAAIPPGVLKADGSIALTAIPSAMVTGTATTSTTAAASAAGAGLSASMGIGACVGMGGDGTISSVEVVGTVDGDGGDGEEVVSASTLLSSPAVGAVAEAPAEHWHEVWATRAVDPVTGEDVVILAQHDVSAKVIAERRVALVMETEHRLLEQLFPRHILQHITEEWTREVAALAATPPHAVTPGAGGGGGGGAAGGGGGGRGGGGRKTTRNSLLRSFRLQPLATDCSSLATWHEQVTLLFADIKGFTPMCKEVQPFQVMRMLNDLFSRWDALLGAYGVHKVETIGDCYFVAGGLFCYDEDGMVVVRDRSSSNRQPDPHHARRVFEFAKAMLVAASTVPLPTTGEPVQIRVGIHSGPVVSGVVGTRMPRFCLFGDTVNTASRLESTGVPGGIHVSDTTRQLLEADDDGGAGGGRYEHEGGRDGGERKGGGGGEGDGAAAAAELAGEGATAAGGRAGERAGEGGWTATGGVEVKGKGVMKTWLWLPQLI